MDSYKKMYLHLFNAVTDALEAMQADNFGVAAEILKDAQLACEEIYLDAEDDEA